MEQSVLCKNQFQVKTKITGMKQEMVILVDEMDNKTGTMEKLEAHRLGTLHRAVSVFIMNSKGEWLLQKRAFSKYHSGGLWTNTCCGHPRPEETNERAANRRLQEEMGLSAGLKEIFQFNYEEKLDNHLTENEIDHVFLGISDEEPVVNPDEVNEWKYVNYKSLVNDMNQFPENYTVWFKIIMNKVNKHIVKNFIF